MQGAGWGPVELAGMGERSTMVDIPCSDSASADLALPSTETRSLIYCRCHTALTAHTDHCTQTAHRPQSGKVDIPIKVTIHYTVSTRRGEVSLIAGRDLLIRLSCTVLYTSKNIH